MGRGRKPSFLCHRCFLNELTNDGIGTTTGMVVACLVASTANWDKSQDTLLTPEENGLEYDSIDGPSEEEAYLQGMSSNLDIQLNSTDNRMKANIKLSYN